MLDASMAAERLLQRKTREGKQRAGLELLECYLLMARTAELKNALAWIKEDYAALVEEKALTEVFVNVETHFEDDDYKERALGPERL
jgi:hypothetical protein